MSTRSEQTLKAIERQMKRQTFVLERLAQHLGADLTPVAKKPVADLDPEPKRLKPEDEQTMRRSTTGPIDDDSRNLTDPQWFSGERERDGSGRD